MGKRFRQHRLHAIKDTNWGAISKRDIYDIAATLIREHGPQAERQADEWAGLMLDRGDRNEHAAWRRVLWAVEEMRHQNLLKTEGGPSADCPNLHAPRFYSGIDESLEFELSDLQRRVEAVGLRFSEAVEDSRERSERLAKLLGELESRVMQGQQEISRRRQALVEASQKKAQILALLQDLLNMAEQAMPPSERMAFYDLEARVERLCDQALSMNGTAGPPEETPHEATRSSDMTGDGAVRMENGELKNLRGSAGTAVVVGSSAVRDILNRVSMITGKLRDI